MDRSCLYLIPSFLAETNDHSDFPEKNFVIIQQIDSFIVENLRTARRFLRKIGYTRSFDEVIFFELNKHTDPNEISKFMNLIQPGRKIGLISEAGVPCVADPGSEVVSLAHELNIKVVPLSGPSSILMALMASGFNGQNFVFHGYLPIDKKKRENKVKQIEKDAGLKNQTQIFMETPYRNNQLLDTILKHCNNSTRLCLAKSITHASEEQVITKSVKDWRKAIPDLHKKPVVFLIN